MKIPSSLGRQAFQQLLANAFAVQESQIAPQSLADIMEVQRSIARGKLDLDGAMRHIVESARNVANASGVAIGLLNGGRLTYRAGTGTSAAYIGEHVTASLTVSAYTRTSREILRVENAHTDTRIEADICRQFGANALLILPIYHNQALAGVLDILFTEAHIFQDREVRTYRLMAEQIEAAMLQVAQPDAVTNFSGELPTIPAPFEPIPSEMDDIVSSPDFLMLPENEHSLYARCGAVFAAITELPVFKQSVSLATTVTQRAKNLTWLDRWRNWPVAASRELSSACKRSALFATTVTQRAKNFTWPDRWGDWPVTAYREVSSVWKGSALFATQRARHLAGANRRSLGLAVAVLLAATGFFAYRGRGPAKSLESSTLPNSSTTDQQARLPKPLPSNGASALQTTAGPSQEARPTGTALKRVRVGPNEVDYIGQDVTIRIFNDRPAIKRSRAPAGRVSHYGDDVTVRYFTPLPVTTKTASR
jgi:putative methionine-R-sulfoxide reductase with GAF domain